MPLLHSCTQRKIKK